MSRNAEATHAKEQTAIPPPIPMTVHLIGSFSENWARWQNTQKCVLMPRAAFPALKIVFFLKETDELKSQYEQMVFELLEWIKLKVAELDRRSFPNSLEEMCLLMANFKIFRTMEKPPKYREKGIIETHFFHIRTKQRAHNQRAYLPPAGRTLRDLEKEWLLLEEAENNRGKAIQKELLRLESAAQLAQRFMKKVAVRVIYLKDMKEILKKWDDWQPESVEELEAAKKKLEAIEKDILPQQQRFTALSEMGSEIERENYHDNIQIAKKQKEIAQQWQDLLNQLKRQTQFLEEMEEPLILLRDISKIMEELKEFQILMSSQVCRKQLLEAKDLLQKHSLVASQISSLGERIRCIDDRTEDVIKVKWIRLDVLQAKHRMLHQLYQNLVDHCKTRQHQLEEMLKLSEFFHECNEEELWLSDRWKLVKALGRDLNHIAASLQSHKTLQADYNSHQLICSKIICKAPELSQKNPSNQKDIQLKIDRIQQLWQQLQGEVATCKIRLEAAAVIKQYFADVDEAESWMQEQETLLANKDYGKDEFSAEALLHRHIHLEKELTVYSSEISHLEEQGHSVTQKVTSVMTSVPVTVMEKCNRNLRTIEGLAASHSVSWLFSETTASGQFGCDPYFVTFQENIWKTQNRIRLWYEKLQSMAEHRKKELKERIQLYQFYSSNGKFHSWIDDKEKIFQTIRPTADNVETMQQKYQIFLTELAAGKSQLDEIFCSAEMFSKSNPGKQNEIQTHMKEINMRWQHLEALKEEKGSELISVADVKTFLQDCQDTYVLIQDKIIHIEDLGHQNKLAVLEAEARKLTAFERETLVLERRNEYLKSVAKLIKDINPDESMAIKDQVEDMEELLSVLKSKIKDKRKALQIALEQENFMYKSCRLLLWADGIKEKLSIEEMGLDAISAEQLLNEHKDLLEEIYREDHRFKELQEMAMKIIDDSSNSRVLDVHASLHKLAQEKNELNELWARRQRKLQEDIELLKFNKEMDSIHAALSSHEAFLQAEYPVDHIDSVRSIVKQHEDFERVLLVLKHRIDAVVEHGDQLVESGHFASVAIEEKMATLREKWILLANNKEQKKKRLLELLLLQEFIHDTAELLMWMEEKYKVASDESYRDPTNILRKLKKHEAAEKEMMNHKKHFMELMVAGNQLVQDNHYTAESIQDKMSEMKKKWEELYSKMMDRGNKLQQAEQKEQLMKLLEDVEEKVVKIEKSLQDSELGYDLHSSRNLLKQHRQLENEMQRLDEKMSSTALYAEKMATHHFDRERILDETQRYLERFDSLQEPLSKRSQLLQARVKLFEFCHDHDMEMKWINERKMVGNTTNQGRSLNVAQSLLQKHKELQVEVNAHKQHITKILEEGRILIEGGHMSSLKIKEKCQELNDSWLELEKACEGRIKQLQQSVAFHQYLTEITELESWVSEKFPLVTDKDYGKDGSATLKLLTKHKALEHEIEIYQNLLMELPKTVQTLSLMDSTHYDEVDGLHKEIHSQLQEMQDLAIARREKLEETLTLHEFLRDYEDLEDWINHQKQVVCSCDSGIDYEHVLHLCAKYETFQRQMKVAAERVATYHQRAEDMLDHGHFESREIWKKQNQLQNCWEELLEITELQGKKIQDAKAVHKCLRDLTEALIHIEEKSKTIPDDIARDLNGVQSQLRKQATLEYELFGNEQQLQELVDAADSVLCKCSVSQAEEIQAKQQAVVDNWEILRCRVEQCREQLEQACRLYRFQTQIRDYLSWASEMVREMEIGEKIRDMTSSGLKINQHQQLLAEIEACDEIYKVVLQLGQDLLLKQKMARTEIQDALHALVEEKGKVYQKWVQKKEWLEKVHHLQMFYKDCEYLENISNSQEMYVKNSDFGNTVDEVEHQIKKHEAFEKLLASQNEKVLSLQEQAEGLQLDNELEKNHIQHKLSIMLEKRRAINDLSQSKREKLHTASLLLLFHQNLAEAESWIDEHMQKLDDSSFQNPSNLSGKMKLLQKHQVFEAEIQVHRDLIAAVNKIGDALLCQNHPEVGEVCRKTRMLQDQWAALKEAVAARGKMLEDSRAFLEFLQKVDHAEAWIRNKEVMINIGDVGNDYEHCLQLMKKLNEFQGGVTVDDAHIKTINALAAQLERENTEEMKTVYQRQKELNERWNSFHGDLKTYRRKLEGTLEIHALIRETDDITERISEKSVLIQTLDYGEDVESVENLIWRHEEMEREIGIIHSRTEVLKLDVLRYCKMNSSSLSDKLTTKHQEMKNLWLRLQGQAKQRGEKLAASYQLQKFNSEIRDLLDWIQEVNNQMELEILPKSVAEAESMIEEHQERKVEIEARAERFDALNNYSQKLASHGHHATPEIHHSLIRLKQTLTEMINAWQEKNIKLVQAKDLQKFLGYLEENESWLGSKEGFLANKDLGDSLSSVERLQQKHMQFERDLENQLEKIDKMATVVHQLRDNQHYDSENIMNKWQGIMRRKERLLEIALTRKHLLEESWLLQKFLHNSFEMAVWMAEKNLIAQDDCWRDPSNLQAKLQKHQTFQAEVMANRSHLNSIKVEGKKMLREGHFASQTIHSRLQEIEELWNELLEHCHEKKKKMVDTYRALRFLRNVDVVEKWLANVESGMKAPEGSNNLLILDDLLKKQEELEESIIAHKDQLQSLINSVQEFQQEKHFLADEIEERVDHVLYRYKSLREPLQERRGCLEASRLQYQFFQDCNEELTWIHEKLSLASSRDYGQCLATVQSLQEKHQHLENEIGSHDALTKAVINTGQKLVKAGLTASRAIMQQVKDLEASFETLKAEAQERRKRLMQSCEAQHFLTELLEVESWMAEKGLILQTSDYGKNEESTQALLRKVEATRLDLEGFKTRIVKLRETGTQLLTSNNPESPAILLKLKAVLEEYSSLQHGTESHRKALQEQSQLHQFEREVQLVDSWLLSKQSMAESDNYGQDLEDVEILEKTFEDFIKEVKSVGHAKVLLVNNLASHLKNMCHSQISAVQQRIQQINEIWERLNQAIQIRAENLRAAHQVHQYDHDVDDLKAWIHEKEAVMDREDYGYDLPGVQTLLSQHERVEKELATIAEELQRIRSEAWHLGRLYPQPRDNIMNRLAEVEGCWGKLEWKSTERKQKLKDAEQVQIYFNDCGELMAWAKEMHALSVSEEVATDHLGAELLIKRHEEYKRDIEKQWLKYEDLEQTGNSLLKARHFMSMEIEEKLYELLELMRKVRECWDLKKELYEENWEIQLLKKELDLAEAWLTAKEGFLSDPNYGHSVSDVEHLLKKHQDFEKMLEAQEEKFVQVNRKTKRELKLLKQIEENKETEKGRLIKVPSLRRKYSDRGTAHTRQLDPKKTQKLPSISSAPTLRAPPEYTGYPISKSKESLHQFSHGENPVLADSNNISTAPPAEVLVLQDLVLTAQNTLLSLSFSNLKTQQTDSDLLQLCANNLKTPNRKKIHEISFSRLEARGSKTVPGRESFDISSTLLHVDLLSQRLEPASQDKTPVLPVSTAEAKCDGLTDYSGKEHAFSLRHCDGPESYCAAPSQKLKEDWMQTYSNLDLCSSQCSLQKDLLLATDPARPEMKSQVSTGRGAAERPITKVLFPRRTPSFKIIQEKRAVGSSGESEVLPHSFKITFSQNSDDSGARADITPEATKSSEDLQTPVINESDVKKRKRKKEKNVFKKFFSKTN